MMSNNSGMGMSAADRIDGNGLVMRGFQLSLVGLAGITLGVASENAWGILQGIGSALGLGLFLAYLVGLAVLYSRAGVWKFIGVLAVKGAVFPWRVTRIIVFSWVFFFVWASISICLVWLVMMIAVGAPWLLLLLAKHFG